MFDNNRHGLNLDSTNLHLFGGVAPSRHALSKQRYLEEKRARLDAEAAARQRSVRKQHTALAIAWLNRLLNAAGHFIQAARISWRARSH